MKSWQYPYFSTGHHTLFKFYTTYTDIEPKQAVQTPSKEHTKLS